MRVYPQSFRAIATFVPSSFLYGVANEPVSRLLRANYVAKSGSDAAACSKAKPCKTVQAAVSKAHHGDKVSVGAGTYAEMVTINQDIALVGHVGAKIDATGLTNGILITGPRAAGAVVQGFTVSGANYEGILAQSTSRVKIAGKVVRGNDLGAGKPGATGECAAHNQVPGDCGEGIHLMSVTNSHVTGNLVTGNSGGILLTDEAGPTARNMVSGNTVVRNLFDCGITVAGHSPSAVSMTGKLAPKAGGIYNNTINNNVANGNGTKGEGAGILLAASGPGAAVYNNVVKDNTANNNFLASVTLHLHAPGSYLNGNKIIGNSVSNDGAAGDPEYGESGTSGIFVGSVVPLKGIVISANRIANVHYGIWTKGVPKIKKSANKFAKTVVVPVGQSWSPLRPGALR
jgi:parallel beta-helix repeat protein